MTRFIAFRILALSDALHTIGDGLHSLFVRMVSRPVISPSDREWALSARNSLGERPALSRNAEN